MKKTVVYISSCAVGGDGKPDPFFLQELPWLRGTFDRVVLCGASGIAEIEENEPTAILCKQPGFAALRAALAAPFCRLFWEECGRLKTAGKLTIRNLLKLLGFTIRGKKLNYWMERFVDEREQTTLYAYWMSYDGFAAALCKKNHPAMRAIARAHAFDIDVARNEMNPFLMKRFMAETLDMIYPISEYARDQLFSYVHIPQEKINVVMVGSSGTADGSRFPAPRFRDNVFHLVSCSSLIAVKDIPRLIDALANWNDGKLEWTHIGGGTEEAAVRAYAEQKLQSHPFVAYSFTGALTPMRVRRLYAETPFDAFVNTSVSEGIPVTFMEALQAGIPVVAPQIGGIPELIDDTVGVLFSRDGGADAVQNALRAIKRQTAEEAERMRAAARERWIKRCAIDRLLPTLFPLDNGNALAAPQKRVLLISRCFAPQNKIGAVRATKLAKYLQRMGYAVTVLAGSDPSPLQDALLARDLKQLADVHLLRTSSLLRLWKEHRPSATASVQPVKAGENAKPSGFLKNALYLLLDDRDDAAFARACVRRGKELGTRFDVVLSTYGPLSSHTAAYRLKKKGIAKRWIADFRDETAMPFAWQKKRLFRYQQKVICNADRITAVSAGCLRVMGMEEQGAVIFNGFDPEDQQYIPDPPKRTDRLAFIHCGQMYGEKRDLSPFFSALADVIRDGLIAADKVALVYAGRDTYGFVKQANDAGLGSCLEDHGFVPRDEALRLQKAAHVLLLPAWNETNRQGNIPGKFLEYMTLDTPVICCVSGDLGNSEIAAIIRSANLGFCFEEVNRPADMPRLKAYLAALAQAFLHGEPMPYSPNREVIAGFTSEGMARKMANIMEEWT